MYPVHQPPVNFFTRKQHSLACFRHYANSFCNVFPASLSNFPFLVLPFPTGKTRNTWRSLSSEGAAQDPPTPVGLQPLLSPRKPSQGINTQSRCFFGTDSNNSEGLVTLSMHFICIGCHRGKRVLA